MSTEIQLEPTCCPLCGMDSCTAFHKGKDQFYQIPGEFQLVRCKGCQHIYMNPRPTSQSIPACYPSIYLPHQPMTTSERTSGQLDVPARTPWYLSRWVRAIPGLRALYYWLTETGGDFFPDLPQGEARAVELGCAGGKFLEQLRIRGWNAQGVELMPEPVEEARRRGFDVRLGTLEQAGFPDKTFNAAFAFQVVEHLADPLGTLQEFHRIMKPDGWLVFSIPNAGSWESWLFGRYWSEYEYPRHLQHFTVQSISQSLTKAGFTDIRILHQRTIQGVLGSLGVMFSEKFPRSPIGPKLKQWYRENPPLWAYLSLAAVVKPLIMVFGSGRITVVARKPPAKTV